MPVRSILLAFVLVLVVPASALAAGTLTVSISGAGGVSGSGIECSKAPGVTATGTCAAEQTGPATITAAPAAGFTFDGWTGACAWTRRPPARSTWQGTGRRARPSAMSSRWP